MKQKSLKVTLSALSLSVALLASGQAMATNYFSAVTALTHSDFTDGTKWTTACGSAAGTGGITLGATDTFTICNLHTLTIGAATTLATVTSAAAITVAAGGTLAATTTNKLTLTANAGIVNNGTITLTNTDNAAITLSGTGTYTGTGVLNSTCESIAGGGAWTAAATWGTTTAACGVTVGTGSLPLPSANSDVIIASTTAVTAGTGTVKSLTFKTGTAGLLTLSGPLSVTGAINFTGAATAVLTIGTNTLTLGGNLTTAAAGNVAGAGSALALTDANHDLTLGGGALTVGGLSLTRPTATRTINVTTNAITAATFMGFGTCTGGAITATSMPVAAYTCTVPAVIPASVDLRESGKVTTTSEEIIIK